MMLSPRAVPHAPLHLPPAPAGAVRRLVVTAVVSVVAFAVLVPFAWHASSVDRLDRRVLDARWYDHASVRHLGDALAFVGSGPAVAVLAFALAGVFWWRTREHWLALAIVAASGGAGVAETVLKKLVERHRPVTASLAGESGYGFPSGHATGAAALFATVVVLVHLTPWGARLDPRVRRATTVVAVLVPFLVAFGRLLAGVHFLTDTLAGIAVGVGSAAVVFAVAFVLRDRYPAVAGGEPDRSAGPAPETAR